MSDKEKVEKFVWKKEDIEIIPSQITPKKDESLEDFISRGMYNDSINMFTEERQIELLRAIYVEEMKNV
jgi:hypothetical protein